MQSGVAAASLVAGAIFDVYERVIGFFGPLVRVERDLAAFVPH